MSYLSNNIYKVPVTITVPITVSVSP